MKSEIFDALQEARAAKRSAVLATDLESGAQALLLEGRQLGDLELGDDARKAAAEAVRSDKSQTLEGKLFLQVFNPPLRLVVVGAVHIAQALAPLAQLSGYEVTIVDPRKAWATPERFPGLTILDLWPDEGLESLGIDHRTAVITLTHDPKLDDPALLVALRSPAFYVGALGSKRTQTLSPLDRAQGAFPGLVGNHARRQLLSLACRVLVAFFAA